MSGRRNQAGLRRAAERAAADEFFLGSALAAYQAEHALDDAGLAAWLGCRIDRLPRLALCRRPEAESARFRLEVEQIAASAGAKPLRLASLLREVDSLSALRHAPISRAALLAARDADERFP